jgi:Mitochondrial ribosomal protein (VAR1)
MYFNDKIINNKSSKNIEENNFFNSFFVLNKYKHIYLNKIVDLYKPKYKYLKFLKNYKKRLNNFMKAKISKRISKILIDINIAEIKFYCNKIIINMYVFNREKFRIIRKLKLLKFNKLRNINNSYVMDKLNLLLTIKLNLLNKKLYLYKYYTSRLFYNNMKFNVNSLLKIKEILTNIFNKKVLLNITNVKYLHLNNDIFLTNLTRKISKKRKSSVLKLIRKGLRFAKIAKLHYLLKVKKLDTYFPKEIKGNFINILGMRNSINNVKNIFSKGTNMHVIGLKLEAKGRLTRRLIASRALKKIKIRGSLNNIYSSINKNSAINFKGFEKSNIVYSNKNSHNLLGSYGVKYWLNSY